MNHKLDIKVSKNNNLDCFDILINTVADYLQEDYRMLFVEHWNIKYSDDKDKKLVSEKIGTGRGEELSYLERYHGIKISPQIYNENLICKNILDLKMPLLVQVDCYEAPWYKTCYHKIHLTTHFILVVGYNDINKNIIIIDNQEASDGYECTMEEFNKFYVKCYQIEKLKEKEDININVILKSMISRLNPQKYTGQAHLSLEEKLNLLVYDLENNFDLFNELGKYINNIIEARLFNILVMISRTRHQAAMVLECLQEMFKIQDFEEVISILNNSGTQWSQFSGILMKSCYIKNNEKYIKRAIEKIRYIKELELCAYEMLEKYVCGDKISTELKNIRNNIGLKDLDRSLLKFNHIDIENYYNCSGCYNEISVDSKSELSNPSRYLMCEKVDDVFKNEFNIMNIDNENNDNIICEGQAISLKYDMKEKNYIMLLMCSEFTSMEENIKIIYADDSFENINIGATAWLKSGPDYNDYIVLEGSPVVVLKEAKEVYKYNFPGYVYGSIYELKKSGNTISNIILPECPNIHIFSITMAY